MINIICKQCNKEYAVKPYLEHKSKYCSYQCYWSSQKNSKRPYFSGKNNPQWRGGKKTYTCPICNKKFLSPKSVPRKNCSAKCQSIAQRGKTTTLGYKHTPEAKDKIRLAHKGKKNYLWKGDKASYRSIHNWVYTWKGKPQICVDCNATKDEKRLAWSNIDHKYHRHLDDYKARCYSCHAIYDKSL